MLAFNGSTRERLRRVYHRRVKEQRQRLPCARLCEERQRRHLRRLPRGGGTAAGAYASLTRGRGTEARIRRHIGIFKCPAGEIHISGRARCVPRRRRCSREEMDPAAADAGQARCVPRCRRCSTCIKMKFAQQIGVKSSTYCLLQKSQAPSR